MKRVNSLITFSVIIAILLTGCVKNMPDENGVTITPGSTFQTNTGDPISEVIDQEHSPSSSVSDASNSTDETTPIIPDSLNTPKDSINEVTNNTEETVETKVLAPDRSQFVLTSLPMSTDYFEINPYMRYFTFEEYLASYQLDDTIVFRGKIAGKSTQHCTSAIDYIETPLTVLEAYYGDVKTGDTVLCYEDAFVMYHDGEPVTHHYAPCSPIIPEEEYIFILYQSIVPQRDGGTLYSAGTCANPHVRISTHQSLLEKSPETLSTIEKRNLDILNYYLNDPDTRIDVQEEAAKLTEGISQDLTQEETLAALPAEQKALLEKMIDQYGVKE